MKKSSFVEGTFIATFAIVFTKILGMLYVIPFYAMVGVQGSALYAYAYNIYSIFLDISSAGLPIAMSKIINEYNTLGMMDAKVRAYHLGKKIMVFLAVAVFVMLFIFAPQIAGLLLGDLQGGNTIADVSMAIRCVSFAILIVPFLSVSKGYLQGHNVINVSSFSQVIEQIVRIIIILGGSYFVLNVLNGTVTTAVCVAVLGAFFGGLVAYIFVKIMMYKNDANNELSLSLDKNITKDKVTDRELVKKIFSYAIPFIIINIISSCYNFVDMALILRTMNYLKLDVNDVEFVTSSITTWAPKINMIISSIGMGMSTSFIPTMVSAYTLKDWKEVNNKFNQAVQILLYIEIPMATGISLLSSAVWTAFYGYNLYGSYILALSIFSSFLSSLYLITSSSLQGLNKYKLVYLSAIIGFGTNALLDFPLMLLFSKIGIPPFLGAVTSSMLGYGISILFILRSLKKECNLNYYDTFRTLVKMFVPLIAMILVVVLCKNIFPVNYDSKLSSIIYIAVNAVVGAIVYFVISYKMGIMEKVLGKSMMNKIKKILPMVR